MIKPPVVANVPTRAGGLRQVLGGIWQARRWGLASIALACALNGQRFVTVEQAVVPAIRWYALGIVLLILAWLGTYQNKTGLHRPADSLAPAAAGDRATRRSGRDWLRRGWRGGVVLLALALNLYSASQIQADYFSLVGGVGWVLSLGILLLATLGHRPDPGVSMDAATQDVEDRTDIQLPRRLEAAILVGIVLLGLAFRLYRLGDLTAGMNVDEGGFGELARTLIDGQRVSPFTSWWIAQPSMSFWAIAATMRVFGTDLFGLRMFSVLVGTLMLIPFYGLTRQLFGTRLAILSGVALAVMEVSVHTSRLALNNIPIPFCLTTGFYFLFRGFATRRLLSFALAGYAFMAGLYFYYAGRLTAPLVGLLLAYLFVGLPLLRLPAAIRAARRAPGGSPAWRRAIGGQLAEGGRTLRYYAAGLALLVVAGFCLASPWLAYYLNNQVEMNGHTGEKLIFNYPDRWTTLYPEATHDPLYLGLRLPRPDDIYVGVPIVFEPTPLSIRLTADGYWARVVWRQATTTLGMFTYRGDTTSFYPFNGQPVVQPLEAVLLVLGLAWAIWRWRDTRMMLLLIWFWPTVIIGGVLTVDAPYFERLPGILPAMAILIALPLNKLAAEFVAAARRLRWGTPRLRERTPQVLTGAILAGLLLFLVGQNVTVYLIHYMENWPNASTIGYALFVQQQRQAATATGQPAPLFASLGARAIFWDQNTNRFVNYRTPGHDLINPANELPLLDPADRDVVFMVWPLNAQYLPLLKAYYPGGTQGDYSYGPSAGNGIQLTYYHLAAAQIAAQRVISATYTPQGGVPLGRAEPGLGTTLPPPPLTYPAQARWTGGLVAAAFARYRFTLTAPGAGRLLIDDLPVLTATTTVPITGEVILAQGVHTVDLTGTLRGPGDAVQLLWTAGETPPAPVNSRYLWAGPGRGLLGTVYPAPTAPDPTLALDLPDDPAAPVLQRRIDAVLGFRDAAPTLNRGQPFLARWTSQLTLPAPGPYQFEIFSAGHTLLLIDGQPAVENHPTGPDPQSITGTLTLPAGAHQLEVRHRWAGGPSDLELFWTPPGGTRTLVGPTGLSTPGGAWVPDQVAAPPDYNLPPEPSPLAAQP